MAAYNLDDRLQENQNVWKEYSEKITIEGVIRSLFLLALIIIVIGYLNQHGAILSLSNVISDFYANASSELLSIVVTVAILERLNSRRADERELHRVKALLASNEPIVTKIAIAELEARGWLKDGSLNSIRILNANLAGGYLSNASLESSYLVLANLEGTYLRGARLANSNLQWANLTDANLQFANLEDSNLVLANLEGTNLRGANLEGINLQSANLVGANLKGAILAEANLKGAKLVGANLRGAILVGANLEDAQLSSTTLPDGKNSDDCNEYDIYTNPDHPEFTIKLEETNEIRKLEGFIEIKMIDE